MPEKPSSISVSTKLKRIAELAKQMPGVALTSLSHHIDIEWLREAHKRTRKGGAQGVDGQTAAEYAENLEENLQSLLDRAKSGTYRAPPVRRVQIPKADGKQMRAIGIPTFEDKVLQRAIAMVLEAVYEQEFLDCSYGFRPGRSAHDALAVVQHETVKMGGGWVLEVDIRKFFDSLDRAKLREVLHQRVRDGVVLRLIGKWLKAGVQEDGSLSYPETGTPQGGVISPMLANIFLHEVLDTWFERDVKPRLKGRAILVRYADDVAMMFSCEEDARRVMAVLPERFEKYGLTLHPDKTRLVEFRRPDRRPPDEGDGRPGSFELLGFTHFWAKSRKGNWVVKQKTAKDRLSRGVSAHQQMVPTLPTRPNSRAARDAEQEVERSLRLLRNHRKLESDWTLPALDRPSVAQMARPPLLAIAHELVEDEMLAAAIPAPVSADSTTSAQTKRSESVV